MRKTDFPIYEQQNDDRKHSISHVSTYQSEREESHILIGACSFDGALRIYHSDNFNMQGNTKLHNVASGMLVNIAELYNLF